MDTKELTAHWEEISNERMDSLPWFYRKLDPDLGLALRRLKIRSGTFLDVGTGPGTQAIELAKLGFEVTAVDISMLAIRKAMVRSRKERVRLEFLQDDLFHTRIDRTFDFMWDRGCFHGTPPDRRVEYVNQIRKLVRPSGYLFLKCFSSLEPGTRGPFRFSHSEIRRLFSADFHVQSITETVYQGTRKPLPRALFCVMRKKKTSRHST